MSSLEMMNKDCLPYDVAQRGLRIVRLDGKPVPEDIR